ncbi:MAG: UDP-N-acetylglucosamine 1-carboxyvinyltransferase [bacterium]|nr:UDP-N-acetylglucosamine 1-carboxyvinyltransferase [bacterium]
MQKFVIHGRRKLAGSLVVESAKNAVLPIIAASILTEEPIMIKNVPKIIDVVKMFEILEKMGGKVSFIDDDCVIDNSHITKFEIEPTLARFIRSSIFMLGPLVARFGKARVAYPGGCDIGSRPIDLHLQGLRELGVEINEEHGFINCSVDKIKSGIIHLDFPSVGATENIMMASVLSEGKTTIMNCAKEPEIVDLANFINSIGGLVSGAGTSTIEIIGVSKLGSGSFLPIPDRIITGTYLLSAAITGGRLELKNANYEHVYSLIKKLRGAGCKIKTEQSKITIECDGRLSSIASIETQPYPGFPTDLQAPLMALCSVSDGMSVITENLFETRFKHVPELIKMGANITIKDRMAIVRGVSDLYGAQVNATDLRGGASLVLAGLVAHGETHVLNANYIDRGYFELENKLNSVGADIIRSSS